MRIGLLPVGLAWVVLSAMPAAPRQGGAHLVFVGTYTSGASRGIYAFRFDGRTGAMTPLGLAAALPNPSFLTASRDGRYVYAVNELETYQGAASGSVTAFAVDRANGRLRAIGAQASRG